VKTVHKEKLNYWNVKNTSALFASILFFNTTQNFLSFTDVTLRCYLLATLLDEHNVSESTQRSTALSVMFKCPYSSPWILQWPVRFILHEFVNYGFEPVYLLIRLYVWLRAGILLHDKQVTQSWGLITDLLLFLRLGQQTYFHMLHVPLVSSVCVSRIR
jgi:hypothetical protein